MNKTLKNLTTYPDTASLLFDKMPRFMYFMKDYDFRFIQLNQQLADKIGLPIDQIIGKTDFDLLPEALATSFRKDDQHIIDSKLPIINKVELIPSQLGQIDWAVTTKVPIFDQQNKVIAITAVTRPLLSSYTAVEATLEISPSMGYINTHYADKIPIATLAKMSSLSVSAFERKFKKILNMTPTQYIRNTRIQAASKLLIQGNKSISSIAVQCGFYDQSHFSKDFSKTMHLSPQNYRNQYRT